MSKRPGTLVLAAVLGLGGLATGVVVAPALATAATTQTTTGEAVGDRVTTIEEALSGLVSDGTITQDQADQVATTLDEQLPKRGHGHGGRGGPGGGAKLEAAAGALGVTVEELRTALQGGQSLADVAQEQGVSTDDLVNALVEETKTRLDEAVTEGLGRGGRGGPPPADAPEKSSQETTPAEPSSRTA